MITRKKKLILLLKWSQLKFCVFSYDVQNHSFCSKVSIIKEWFDFDVLYCCISKSLKINVIKKKSSCVYFEFRYIETISGSFLYLQSDVASNGGVVTKDIYYLLCLCRSFVKPTLFIHATICHFDSNVMESLSYFEKKPKTT